MKNRRKLLATLLLVPMLCMLLSGCPRLWGSAGSNSNTRGGVVVEVPF